MLQGTPFGVRLTIHFGGAVHGCVCGMRVVDEVHAVFLAVQGAFWPAIEKLWSISDSASDERKQHAAKNLEQGVKRACSC